MFTAMFILLSCLLAVTPVLIGLIIILNYSRLIETALQVEKTDFDLIIFISPFGITIIVLRLYKLGPWSIQKNFSFKNNLQILHQ